MNLFAKRHRRRHTTTVSLLLMCLILAACGSANTGNGSGSGSGSGSTPTAKKNCTNVGILLPETDSSARWDSKDRPALTDGITKAIPNAHVDYANAANNADQQQTQAEADLSKGDCILIVAAVDGSKASAIVAKAKQKNVPVIAYDRLIYSNDLSYYVSFDNVNVGKLQGQYIADHLADFTKNGKNLAMINGSQTDNNALLFKQGALEVLQPLIDQKKLNLVYSTFTPAWNNATAQQEMEGALTKNNNNIQVAYVANDGMAGTVIAALKAHNLNKKVLVTGQDATAAGIQNILTGDQNMTVYKDISKEANDTISLVKALSTGASTDSITNGNTIQIPTSGGAKIPSVLETPVSVDKTNFKSVVIDSGYVTKADLCNGLPAGTNSDGVCS